MNQNINTIVLDGKKASENWLVEIANKIKSLNTTLKIGIVQLGNNPASNAYIKNKLKIAAELNVKACHIKLDLSTSEKELLDLINKYNKNQKFDGLLIQLPLPKHINEITILKHLDKAIDVDGLGFNAVNFIWMTKNFNPLNHVVPCTPKGIIKLLEFYNISCEGKNVVIINRSNIVGKPLAALLLSLNATVTICHTKTKNLNMHLKTADIIVSGVGVVDFLKPNQIPPHATVIDVSINFDANQKLVGDVRKASLQNICYAYSPVPKGVGPMTVAAIFDNLYLLGKQKNKNK